MGRKRNNEDDWRRFNKFKEDNQRLKKELTKLRKLVKEVYSDKLEERLRRQEDGLEPIKPLCEVCGNDDLNVVPINRPDGKFEIKVCNNCGTRSSMKKVKRNERT